MSYLIDLKNISINDFKKRLRNQYMIKSQLILKEDIDQHFKKIQKMNIKNLDELQKHLKTKDKINSFSKETSLPINYLSVLRREINSYGMQKRKIKDFSVIDGKIKKKLEAQGIKTTEDLYSLLLTKKARKNFADKLFISEDEVLFLAKLCEVCRLRYVTPEFGVIMINSSYDSIEKIRKANPSKLYDGLVKTNTKNKIFKGKIDSNYMQFLIDDAHLHSLDIIL